MLGALGKDAKASGLESVSESGLELEQRFKPVSPKTTPAQYEL